MALFTNYKNKVLDHINGVAALSPESSVFFSLSTTTPNPDGTGITEPVGNNYARVEKTNSSVLWDAADAGAADNKVAVDFPEASGSWSTITHVVVYGEDNATKMWYGELAVHKPITENDVLSLRTGDIDWSIT